MPRRILKKAAVLGLLASMATYCILMLHPEMPFITPAAETIKWASLGGAGMCLSGALTNLRAMEFKNAKYYVALAILFVFGAGLNFITLAEQTL